LSAKALVARKLPVYGKKSHKKKVRRQVGKKVTRKKVAGKKVTIYFFHIHYTPESHSMYNEWLCPYPGYGIYSHFQKKFCDMVAFCFIIAIYFKFGFIRINNNIWSAHTVHTYYLITRTNINLIFELYKLITGKQIGTTQLPKAQIFISPIISLIFLFLLISQLLKLFYFSTISYLDCWEKINNVFTNGNREKIISSRLFIFVWIRSAKRTSEVCKYYTNRYMFWDLKFVFLSFFLLKTWRPFH
jgi:hypothetical protein